MLLNIHNEESLRIRNKKFSSEWPFKRPRRQAGTRAPQGVAEKIFCLIVFESVA
jgi:hypothetical protein